MASGIFKEAEENKWVLCGKHEDLFAEIDECVKHILDLERATSAMYLLMNRVSPGKLVSFRSWYFILETSRNVL